MRVVGIDARDLCNPVQFRQALGVRKATLARAELEGGIPGLVRGRLGVTGIQETINPLLRKVRKLVLLILDEAQTLENATGLSSERRLALDSVLSAIHNGKLKKPVFLLFAGLGRTREVLSTLGISRFGEGAFVELSGLDKESEHAVLYDWLTRDGGAKENPVPWINAIAQETHGWPQHILAYIKPALTQLQLDQGAMTSEGLNVVLDKGRAARVMYYEHRADGLRSEMRKSLARPFREIPAGESLSYDRIMASLTQDFSPDQADTIFRRAERKGIISSRDGDYMIPIASMQNWLVSNYAIERTKGVPPKSPDQGQEQSRPRTNPGAGRDETPKRKPDSRSKSKEASSPPKNSKSLDSGIDLDF